MLETEQQKTVICDALAASSRGTLNITHAGATDDEVRAIAEYKARGANSHDISRHVRNTLARFGADNSNVRVQQVASIQVEHGCNADLVSGLR